jgi:hypothetical protein
VQLSEFKIVVLYGTVKHDYKHREQLLLPPLQRTVYFYCDWYVLCIIAASVSYCTAVKYRCSAV